MAKRSNEGFIEGPNGERDDLSFHEDFLDNPEANTRSQNLHYLRALEAGHSPALAFKMYLSRDPALPQTGVVVKR